jgi:hypothetical protein
MKKFKVACLIRADKPTANNNIYPREVLEKMMTEAKEKGVFVYKEACQKNLGDVVASVQDIDIKEDGSVTIDITPIKEEYANFFEVARPDGLNSTVMVDTEKDYEKQEDGTYLIKRGRLVSFSLK